MITYYDPEGTPNNSCDKATCKGVEVRLANFAFTPISPFMNFGLTTVPPFHVPDARKHGVGNAAGDGTTCFI